MKKQFLLLVSIFSLAFSIASAQQQAPKTISGGVVNGKARLLAKPVFPPAARAVRAEGAVSVQVVIDEQGDVVSATAVSGHPLLRQAAEQAAQASKFSPTKLQGQAVRVTGIIVYNFILPVPFIQLGYELAAAEKSLSIDKSRVAAIAGSFPRNWEERDDLEKLNLYLDEKTVKENKSDEPSKPKSTADDAVATQTLQAEAYKGNVLTVQGVSSSSTPLDVIYKLDADAVEAVRQLQTKIANRLRVNDKIFWSFKLGAALGKLKTEIENGEKTQSNIAELTQLQASAPAGIPESATTKVLEIVELVRQSATTAAKNEKLLKLIDELRSSRELQP